MIPYGRQTIEEDDIEEVVKVLKSDFLTTGPKVAEFERAVAEYVGAKYAVAISNDTAALHAACHAAGIGPGDEVITTPVTSADQCLQKPAFRRSTAHSWRMPQT